jgi:hypothetical protein
MRGQIIVWLGLMLCCGGCGKPDLKQIADSRVRNMLLTRYQKTEAIPFLEQQGKLFDAEAMETVDRDVVLPLLQRLQEVDHTEQWVMLRPGKTDSGFALLIQLPADIKIVDRMAEAIEQADDQFSGFIVQQWGQEWLALGLMDQGTYDIMKKSNPNIDKQR